MHNSLPLNTASELNRSSVYRSRGVDMVTVGVLLILDWIVLRIKIRRSRGVDMLTVGVLLIFFILYRRSVGSSLRIVGFVLSFAGCTVRWAVIPCIFKGLDNSTWSLNCSRCSGMGIS